jgi:lipoyl(octanoyl) transferase
VTIAIERLGTVPFEPTWRAMQALTRERGPNDQDRLWFLQHEPVFTLGLAGKPEHVLDPGALAVVKTDRGGQVTFHGPGQIVAYALLDLRRLGFGVKELVRRLEQAIIDTLADFGIVAARRAGMPGVYVSDAKIAAIGLRVSRGCTYHGIALNVDMDLAPFAGINPCGYAGLATTSMAALGVRASIAAVQERLEKRLLAALAGHS